MLVLALPFARAEPLDVPPFTDIVVAAGQAPMPDVLADPLTTATQGVFEGPTGRLADPTRVAREAERELTVGLPLNAFTFVPELGDSSYLVGRSIDGVTGMGSWAGPRPGLVAFGLSAWSAHTGQTAETNDSTSTVTYGSTLVRPSLAAAIGAIDEERSVGLSFRLTGFHFTAPVSGDPFAPAMGVQYTEEEGERGTTETGTVRADDWAWDLRLGAGQPTPSGYRSSAVEVQGRSDATEVDYQKETLGSGEPSIVSASGFAAYGPMYGNQRRLRLGLRHGRDVGEIPRDPRFRLVVGGGVEHQGVADGEWRTTSDGDAASSSTREGSTVIQVHESTTRFDQQVTALWRVGRVSRLRAGTALQLTESRGASAETVTEGDDALRADTSAWEGTATLLLPVAADLPVGRRLSIQASVVAEVSGSLGVAKTVFVEDREPAATEDYRQLGTDLRSGLGLRWNPVGGLGLSLVLGTSSNPTPIEAALWLHWRPSRSGSRAPSAPRG